MPHVLLTDTHFPPDLIGLKIAIALTIGLLAGLEREWAHKETGVRTFALVCLLGMASSLLAQGFVMVAFGGVLLLVAFTNIRTLMADRSAEMTTSVALMLNFFLGVLVGYGHLFTPVALAIVMTLLLSLKPELTSFTGVLLRSEIRSAVLVGLIGFVIYPILPDRFIDPWHLLNPRTAWAIVVVLALIGFGNYLLLRLYGSRGLYLTAILGGAVNSTATVAQLTQLLASGETGLAPPASLILMANLAMFLRNLVIVILFAPGAAILSTIPLLAMAAACVVIVYLSRTHDQMPKKEFSLPSPVSLKSVLLFSLIFLAIAVGGIIASRWIGQAGYVIVGFIGGLVSSASTAAAAASAFAKGQTTSSITALAVTLASVASVLVNLPIVFRKVPDRAVGRALSIHTAIIIGVGLAALALTRL
jgi:uncharacterized membrane protein (DUF4010 family)